MKIELYNDALVRAYADRPHLLEQALAELVIDTTHPDDLTDEDEIACFVEMEIRSFDERDEDADEEYGSVIEELFETGVVCIDTVVEIVQHLLQDEAA
jgi:hypothetical protein